MQTQRVINIGFGEEPGDEELPAAPVTNLFRDNELLAGISADAYAQLERLTDFVQYNPREIIFEEEQPGDYLYLIAQGTVKISKRGRAGTQETLTTLGERDFFGEMALVDGGRRSAQASAVGHVVLGRVDRDAWDLLLRLAPHQMLSNFTRATTNRLRANNQHFIEQMMRNERLALLGTTINSIVHDMNDPIACILEASEAMQTAAKDHVTTEMAGVIRTGVQKMQTMTRELLDYSSGTTKLDVRTITVRDLLADLEPEFALCRPAVALEVEVSYSGTIRVDKLRLNRLFANLIRNAREAMKNTERKALQFKAVQVDDKLHIEVSDTGCGIPAQRLAHLFEPFAAKGQAKGAGLGLAIGKAVVEAHGGTIRVTSNSDGTVFVVALPLDS